MFLGVLGLLAFIIFIAMGVMAKIKKNGKAKRNFLIALAGFVFFMIGVAGSPAPTEDKASNEPEEETESTVKAEETNKKEDNGDYEQMQEEEQPATVADVKKAITREMSFNDYEKAKDKLNVEHSKTISIGDGNVGNVLQAEDGIIVANTDGSTVLDVIEFKSMDKVNNYEKEMVAKAEAKAKKEAKEKREASKINLSGSGDTATDVLKLDAGFAVFEGTHKGGSNFAVKLQDVNGNDMELLVNTIGSYNGKTFAMIPNEGDYYLNITAGGNWDFTVYQTIPLDVPAAPTTIEGSGDDVVFVNVKSGVHKLSFTNNGQSNFVVMLNGQNLLVNEIGNYEGSSREQFQTDGEYAFVVNSEGKWSITIE